MGWIQPDRTASFPTFHGNDYSMGEIYPSIISMPPYANPAFTHSQEHLMTPDPMSASAISPLTLDPFTNHYLGIPSPRRPRLANVRLSNLGSHKREEIFVKLDKVGRLHEVSSALELPDESWEMVVLKSYFPELEIRLGEIFPGCHFDPIYDPTKPSKEDVERLFVAATNSKLPTEPGEMAEDVKRCYTVAKILRIDASSSKAMAMIREQPWPVAAVYYYCLPERHKIWLKENAPYSRIEAECCWVIRKRSWWRLLSLLNGRRRSIVLSWKDICLGSMP
ncbi:hypothetical protein BKA61DRAFT_703164 [Leptodontidium sp. MPI-SDFR-AT-0119]|nr:hypothetical protein BKA61DRAFT_703164 [Leptodontidium sp. MPI-SDFR-AT-0119]